MMIVIMLMKIINYFEKLKKKEKNKTIGELWPFAKIRHEHKHTPSPLSPDIFLVESFFSSKLDGKRSIRIFFVIYVSYALYLFQKKK